VALIETLILLLRAPLYYRFAGRSTQAVVVISTDVRLDVRVDACSELASVGCWKQSQLLNRAQERKNRTVGALIKYEHRDMIVAH
jgi:hypothetical protein